MFSLHKNDACSMFWFSLDRQSGKLSEVDVSEEGGKGLVMFLWTKLTNESTLTLFICVHPNFQIE